MKEAVKKKIYVYKHRIKTRREEGYVNYRNRTIKEAVNESKKCFGKSMA